LQCALHQQLVEAGFETDHAELAQRERLQLHRRTDSEVLELQRRSAGELQDFDRLPDLDTRPLLRP